MNAPPTGALSRFQDGFTRALDEPGAALAPEIAMLTAQPAFAVYRNTVMKGCVDALQANFPAVTRLVGEEWFRAAAAVHVREALPADPTLLRYGKDFSGFLARFAPATELPYLPGVARLDRFWTEAHEATSFPALEPTALANLSPEALAGMIMKPHPAARWAWFPDGPIYTIWSRNRADRPFEADFEWRPEGALIVRPLDKVEWVALDAAGCAFLDACAAGGTLGDAAQAALLLQEDADLAQLLETLLKAGAFQQYKGKKPA